MTIVLPLIEGVVDDVTSGAKRRRFFKPKESRRLIDDGTVVGHPSNLAALGRVMSNTQTRTEATGQLIRNGVLHGKELAYGTRRNSTKVLVALIAVIDWLQPIAHGLREAESHARINAHAGSDEVDDDGRHWTAATSTLQRGFWVK